MHIYWISTNLTKKWKNRKQVKATLADAEKDGVIVPTTLEEYCVQASTSRNEEHDDCILGKFLCPENKALNLYVVCFFFSESTSFETKQKISDDLDDLDPYDIDEYDEEDNSQCNSNTDSGNEET